MDRSAKGTARPTPESRRRHGWEIVVGSGALWAWGFLCYLSPALIPNPSPGASVGLEFGFFASQATVTALGVLLAVMARRCTFALGPGVFLGAAALMALATVAIPAALLRGLTPLVVAFGVLSGVTGTLCGAAWGARYTLISRNAPGVIVLSFLFAYLLYLGVVALVPRFLAPVVVAALPVVSMALRTEDAARRHGLSAEVFPRPSRQGDEGASAVPGEVLAGSWEMRLLPWRAVGAVILASFIGNFIASSIMGLSYRGADSLFAGGVVVCALISAMALLPLTTLRGSRAVSALYRTTVTCTVAGLLFMLALGSPGMAMGGALVQGCAMFLQVLVYALVTESTRREGLAPLLSFSMGQAVISAVVLAGNVFGKQFYLLGQDAALPFNIACAVGVLVLFLLMVGRAAPAERSEEGTANALGHVAREDALALSAADGSGVPEGPAQGGDGSGEAVPSEASANLDAFAAAWSLTPRETEVLGYLVRGRSLPYIADILFVTTGTVKTHVKHIYRKCSVGTRQELLDLFEGGS